MEDVGELKKNVVVSDKFDTMAFEEMVQTADKLSTTIAEITKKIVTADGLASDIFNTLYKYVIRWNNEEIVRPEYRFNRPFVEKGMETKEYQQLRALTRLKPVESALATTAILNTLMKEIEENPELQDYIKQIQTTHDLSKKLQSLQLQLDGYNVAYQSAKTQRQKTKLQQKIDKIKNQIDNINSQINQQLQQQPAPSIRHAISTAMKKAVDNLNDFAEMSEVCWGLGKGKVQELTPEQKLRIAELLIKNEKVQKLAKLLGRYKRLAICKWKNKITKQPTELHDVVCGNDFQFMIPSEAVYLLNPYTEVIFYKKIIERELLQYKLQGKERLAKGDIIVCVDNSGSMEGEKEIWSKAVAISLLQIAMKEKRNLVVIHFGGPNDTLKIIEIDKNDDNTTKLNKIIEVATYFLGGGTDFEKPLRTAIQKIEQGYNKADIVFITDGECDVSDGFIDEFKGIKEKYHAKMISVVINGRSDTLEKISDRVITLRDIIKDGDDTAGEIFSFI
ncbi:MAG: VWA domain-containing protein [Thermoplasmata archaeon]